MGEKCMSVPKGSLIILGPMDTLSFPNDEMGNITCRSLSGDF